jgi:hypothetical protein
MRVCSHPIFPAKVVYRYQILLYCMASGDDSQGKYIMNVKGADAELSAGHK